MEKIRVQVREDHLEVLARSRPLSAVAELIWNALDAEATEVSVEFVENELGGVRRILVRDNGLGLPHAEARNAFGDLGGSWKRTQGRTVQRQRLLHGQYGKGRFRAFTLGSRVTWQSVYAKDDKLYQYEIYGDAARLGEFVVTSPFRSKASHSGVTVIIENPTPQAEELRGVNAQQTLTDAFALYLRQYPDVRIRYDHVPLDPEHAELRRTDYDLEPVVTPSGKKVQVHLLIIEWRMPGKRGVFFCDEKGFLLEPSRMNLLFRGFSYSAYALSPFFVECQREDVLTLSEMHPDLSAILQRVRQKLREHFALREAENAKDLLAQWKQEGIYPYEDEPRDNLETAERKIFDIYATHLYTLFHDFNEIPSAHRWLVLQLLKELVHVEPMRVAHILNGLLRFPLEKEEQIRALMPDVSPVTSADPSA